MSLFLFIFSIVHVFNSQVLSTMVTSLTLHNVTDTLTPENVKYGDALSAAGDAFCEVEKLFQDENYIKRIGWKKDEENDEGIIVYAKSTNKGKMVTVSTELPMNVDKVMTETWNGLEELPQWNDNIKFAKTLASPTSNFDIITYGNNDVLIVSGRDFVSSRIYRKTDTGYILASRSISLSDYPEQKGKVRANLILAGAQFRPHKSDLNKTLVDVIMLVDLKGYLPTFVVNQVLGKIMMMDVESNRKHFEELSKKEKPNA